MFFTLQGLTVAEKITADTKKTQDKAENELTDNAVRQQIDRAEYRHSRSGLRQSREFWQAEALRTTDLWPGESIRGLIFFPTNEDASLYHILMKLEDHHFDT